jgi:hypothetical protein
MPMRIGKERPAIVVEPLEEPVDAPLEQPVPVESPAPAEEQPTTTSPR